MWVMQLEAVQDVLLREAQRVNLRRQRGGYRQKLALWYAVDMAHSPAPKPLPLTCVRLRKDMARCSPATLSTASSTWPAPLHCPTCTRADTGLRAQPGSSNWQES